MHFEMLCHVNVLCFGCVVHDRSNDMHAFMIALMVYIHDSSKNRTLRLVVMVVVETQPLNRANEVS